MHLKRRIMNVKNLWLLITVLAVASACNNAEKKKANAPEAVALKTDDEMFLALKDTAQAKIGMFIDSLKSHGLDSNYRFMVKSDFVDGKEHEHMWSMVYKYANGSVTGAFVDSAYFLKNIKSGDNVNIKTQDIEDWAMYDNVRNTSIGNFSDKYLRSKERLKD